MRFLKKAIWRCEDAGLVNLCFFSLFIDGPLYGIQFLLKLGIHLCAIVDELFLEFRNDGRRWLEAYRDGLIDYYVITAEKMSA